MKSQVINKIKIDSFEIDYIKNDFILTKKYKTKNFVYTLSPNELKDDDFNAISKYQYRTHDLYLYLEGSKFLYLEAKESKILKGSAIDKYQFKDYPPLDYINYHHYNIFTQLDGITAIVGMTGGGKTYSALSMLPTYANVFDKIAYLNYELTDRDIVRRFKKMYNESEIRDKVLKKLFIKEGIMTNLNIEEIMDDMNIEKDDHVVFIIDNVGSVIGQEDNIWRKQNEFLKDVDTMCKERGYHALALTQIVKDNSLKLFDDTGEFSPTITSSVMSGSIVLANLSRTVLLTGFNKFDNYKRKVLKRGTGIMYHDLEKGECINDKISVT